MKKLGKKLSLHRETLQDLDSRILEQPRGGVRRSDSSLDPRCNSECSPVDCSVLSSR
jgi:hypothetical protein